MMDIDTGEALPRERACPVCLIAFIDLHSGMSASAAQASTFAAVAHIFECSRIEQKISSVSNQANAQRIRVPVPSTARAQRPGIDQ